VHWLTGGVPRLINNLCDRSLLAAYAHSKTRVGAGLVRTAAREVGTGIRPRPRWRFAAILFSVALAAGAGAFGVWQMKPERLARFIGAGSGGSAADAVSQGGSSATFARTGAGAPAPAALRRTPVLAQLLAEPGIPTDTDAAFSALFAQWGFDYAQFTGATGCERAVQTGLRCLFESGTWSNLRQLNRPVIVELVDDAGTRHHVLVVRTTA
jgi:general secretion pathway protein A